MNGARDFTELSDTHPLLAGAKMETLKEKRVKPIVWAIGIFALILSTVTLSIKAFGTLKETFDTTTSIEEASAPGVEVHFDVTSELYPSTAETAKYLTWDMIVEPFKEQTVSIKSVSIDGEDLDLTRSDLQYSWDFGDVTSSLASPTITMTKTGVTTDCMVTITSSTDSDFTVSYVFQMAVKYIRREIRQLAPSEKDKFMDAMKIMYTISTEEGQEKYGEKFRSIEDYLSEHLAAAGTSDCDHWHDGAGFVTHHFAYTLEVEQTLQAIDSSIALPYWEYGIDAAAGGDINDAVVFNSSWFGAFNPDDANHCINDGSFWSTVTVPSGKDYMDAWDIAEKGSLNPYVNGYGQLRSPWNNNPNDCIGRSGSVYGLDENGFPQCNTFLSCYASESYSHMAQCINGNTHGPVHIAVGGAFGQGDNLDGDLFVPIKSHMLTLGFKMLWRQGIARCPSAGSCSLDTPQSECSCYLPDEYIDELGVWKILNMTGMAWDFFDLDEEFHTEENALAWLRALSNPFMVGESFTSAASFDPIFWPLHGGSERMLATKRLAVANDPSIPFDETWGYVSDDITAVYLHGSCDWSSVTGPEDLTLPTCTYSDDACIGHNEHDDVGGSNFLGTGETYTNKEFYEFINPLNADLPYVYDRYDFTYCA